MNIGWQEFLSFYTGLNVARKKYDEKFQEERGIGEEVDDPQNSSSEDEYNQPVNETALPPRNRLTVAYSELEKKDQDSKDQSQLKKPLLEDDNKRPALEEERKSGEI